MKIVLFTIFLTSLSYAKITFKNPYIRLMPPGMKISAGFVKIENSNKESIELISASSDLAGVIELHIHAMEEGVMAMRKVDKMKIPAKGSLELKPKSNHLMLFKIKKELVEGDEHIINLKFSDDQIIKVPFKVKAMKNTKHKH